MYDNSFEAISLNSFNLLNTSKMYSSASKGKSTIKYFSSVQQHLKRGMKSLLQVFQLFETCPAPFKQVQKQFQLHLNKS